MFWGLGVLGFRVRGLHKSMKTKNSLSFELCHITTIGLCSISTYLGFYIQGLCLTDIRLRPNSALACVSAAAPDSNSHIGSTKKTSGVSNKKSPLTASIWIRRG